MGLPVLSLFIPEPSPYLSVVLQVGARSVEEDGRHFQRRDRCLGMATRNAPLGTLK